jgi:predicted porin
MTTGYCFTVLGLALIASTANASDFAIFGAVDTSVAHISVDGKGVTGLANRARSGSKLGFRGSEELGGGYKINLWLEGSFDADTGGSAFQFGSHSSLGLQGGFGELRLGRDSNILSSLRDDFTPSGGSGMAGLNGNNQLSSTAVGLLTGSSPWSNANSIIYWTPNVGGAYARLGHSFGEQEGNTSLGSNTAMRVGYASGPLHVAMGFNIARGGTLNEGVNYTTYNLGASYWIKGMMPMVLLGSERGNGKRMDLCSLGFKSRFGSHELRVGYTYFKDRVKAHADSQRLALGYSYILSKRTEIYSAIARLSNEVNAARKLASALSHSVSAGQSMNGYEVGIYHKF